MAAMFWLKWLVTAESNSDPQAAINSHSVFSPGLGTASGAMHGAAAVPAGDVVAAAPLAIGDGCGGGSVSRVFEASLLPATMMPQTTTNTRNPTDHASVCVRRLKFGSISTG